MASSSSLARALWDFQAQEAGDLCFQAGNVIMLLDTSDGLWWKVRERFGVCASRGGRNVAARTGRCINHFVKL